MALTKSTLDTLIEAANTAIEAGDLDTAKSKLAQADGVLGALPNTPELTWSRMGLRSAREALNDLIAASSSNYPRRAKQKRPRY